MKSYENYDIPLLEKIPEQTNWQSNDWSYPGVLPLQEQTIVNGVSMNLQSTVLSLKHLLICLLKGFFSC